MSKRIFITGTDTSIGKTYVSRLVADALSLQGKRVTYFKPVQTGCTKNSSGELCSPDADFVFMGKALKSPRLNLHVPYQFEPACSPHLAAEMAKCSISFEYIDECLKIVSKDADFTIVEGAGGVLAPLSEKLYMLDLMIFLEISVLLVTSPYLGTLNHTLLSFNALQNSGLNVAGLVFNNAQNCPEDFIHRNNIEFLRRQIYPTPVLNLSYSSGVDTSVKEFCCDLERSI